MVKMIIYKDEVFGFFEIFNEENGTLFRSDINGVDPVMNRFLNCLMWESWDIAMVDNIVGTLGLIVTKKVLQHMLHICHMRILWKL